MTEYSDGSYTLFDSGGRGDIYALTPRLYGPPEWLSEYFDLATALREATNTCALQQGVCWVVRRGDTLPRCGQRGGRGECNNVGPFSPGLSGLGGLGGDPVAVATPEGVALVKNGCVLPLWQRIFSNTQADNFLVAPPSQTYQAAVRAAMVLATSERKARLVYGWGRTGKPVPLVYVHPGGLVRSVPSARGAETQIEQMDSFEFAQALAASRGASLMPFGM